MVTFSLEEIAGLLKGEPSQRPGPTISGVGPLEFARETDITYVAGKQFANQLASSSACAVLISKSFEEISKPWIRVENPEAAFARLTQVFYPYPKSEGKISSKAEIHPSAMLGRDVSIGPFTVIEENVRLGAGAQIGSHVVIGADSTVGADSFIFPNVTIYAGVTIGARVIIHSGSVIGSDGFGYARDSDESGAPINIKKHHTGTVLIEDDVEIGALVAIDRALSGVTCICKGVKIDNLVQVAHNVEIGDATVIASQVGIAGSSTVGKYGLIGGQAGVRDHVSVGDGVILATRVGIYRNVPSGSIMAGSIPAMPHSVFLRVQSLFKRLPEILERVRKLERLLASEHKESV
jgi:UDP-3-O-[3-hydroxymyristoyl] glucosamine N-acyltransferase